ncbi:hypothetical protein ACJIZ3_001154 [Penstemon smallii]|uniref:Myb/SANT-like domain-containing protein n=1 Tax=Penstemon smallii TaxID=265156 RepID=A0ABD3U4J5_9LAMI
MAYRFNSHAPFHNVSETPYPPNGPNSCPSNLTSTRVTTKTRATESVKATWDNNTTEVFIHLCVQEMGSGNRPGSHFNKNGWDNLVKKFSLSTNRKYTRIQLKNKWDTMKKEWSQWQSLLRGETGLGWDNNKGTVDAPPEWWHRKIQANPHAAKFREKGPACLNEQEMLFSDVVANGESSWTPSFGVLPPHMQDETEEDESEHEPIDDSERIPPSHIPPSEGPIDSPTEAPTVTPTGPSVRRKSTDFLNRIRPTKPKKVSTANKIARCLERMVDTMEHESASTRTSTDTGRQYSIHNCLQILGKMPGINRGDPLYMYATRLFLKPAVRELFYELDDDEIRLQWLEEQMEIGTRRRDSNYYSGQTSRGDSRHNDHASSG